MLNTMRNKTACSIRSVNENMSGYGSVYIARDTTPNSSASDQSFDAELHVAIYSDRHALIYDFLA
jgi:hypothetical protein